MKDARDIVPRATAEWEGTHFTDCEVEVEQYEWARKYARPLLTEIVSLRKQLEDAREALRHIKIEAEREQGHWQHLKRVIAVHADEALKGKS